MEILVFIRLVPDLVEELTIDDTGKDLDREWLRLIINEFDDHALEQAIFLKEQVGGRVTVATTDLDGAEDVLYAASARGADQLIKLCGNFNTGVNNHSRARAYNNLAKEINPDLILTGVQAHDDLDGSVGPLLAGLAGLPYTGYVSGISLKGGEVLVRKEYPGGLLAEVLVELPSVLGIQSAEQPPRYVAISKIRQAMQSAEIAEVDVSDLDPSGAAEVGQMFLPETGGRASMIEGDEETVAARLIEIFKENNLL